MDFRVSLRSGRPLESLPISHSSNYLPLTYVACTTLTPGNLFPGVLVLRSLLHSVRDSVAYVRLFIFL